MSRFLPDETKVYQAPIDRYGWYIHILPHKPGGSWFWELRLSVQCGTGALNYKKAEGSAFTKKGAIKKAMRYYDELTHEQNPKNHHEIWISPLKE